LVSIQVSFLTVESRNHSPLFQQTVPNYDIEASSSSSMQQVVKHEQDSVAQSNTSVVSLIPATAKSNNSRVVLFPNLLAPAAQRNSPSPVFTYGPRSS
jgi:hypothetical protein